MDAETRFALTVLDGKIVDLKERHRGCELDIAKWTNAENELRRKYDRGEKLGESERLGVYDRLAYASRQAMLKIYADLKQLEKERALLVRKGS